MYITKTQNLHLHQRRLLSINQVEVVEILLGAKRPQVQAQRMEHNTLCSVMGITWILDTVRALLLVQLLERIHVSRSWVMMGYIKDIN